MIVFDLYLNSYSFIIFLPFFTYLINNKKSFYLYFIYGVLMDLYLLNLYFMNTILFCLIYILYPKNKRKIKYYFLKCYLLFFLINLIIYNNLIFFINPLFVLSLLINYFYFIFTHKLS